MSRKYVPVAKFFFRVNTEGASRYTTESYHWTASVGKIIKGEHTSEVVIDATGFEGQELTVEVSVGGFDPSCSTTVAKAVLLKHY